MGLNETHNPSRESWVESANAPGCDFPLQNLPWGVFSSGDDSRRVGVAIGDMILDVTAAEANGLLRPSDHAVFDQGVLNPFMALPPDVWSAIRARI